MPERESCLLHDWLAQTAAEFPRAAAVVEDGKVTLFGDLLAQVESLAASFARLGVRQGDRIALILPKTTEAIIAIFASLLAGAAYVPIHPRWPKERIDATLDDCAPAVTISASEYLPRISRGDGGEIIEWNEALSMRPAARVARESQPSDPALILFTSGSTGRPKGVVLSHRAVSVFVRWTAREFGICSQDRVASPSPLGFDLSTFDIFNMALCGATCVLVSESISWMPRFLTQFVREARVTCWYSVPSILAGMLQDGGLADAGNPDLRLVLFAGEVFPSPKVARLRTAVPHAVFANLYGPTETNVVTWYPVPQVFHPSESLPIGKPCPYAEVTLDAQTGELLAGGESTMIGYWNRPEETARAFSVVDGKRYYRTGDRVTRRDSGDYVFVGRLDRQVKRRGFRIELGEIEAALARHEAVLESAAVASGNGNSGVAITAFVRIGASGAGSPVELKAYCAKLLPLYMLPDRVVFIDSIPKGNRGKIDYAALEIRAEESRDGY